jgi:hypothetical protein
VTGEWKKSFYLFYEGRHKIICFFLLSESKFVPTNKIKNGLCIHFLKSKPTNSVPKNENTIFVSLSIREVEA